MIPSLFGAYNNCIIGGACWSIDWVMYGYGIGFTLIGCLCMCVHAGDHPRFTDL